MRPIEWIALISFTAATSGCANLSVQVDVLDPSYAASAVAEQSLRVEYYRIQQRGPLAEADELTKLSKDAAEKLNSLAAAYDEYAGALTSDNEKTILTAAAGSLRKAENTQGRTLRNAAAKITDRSTNLLRAAQRAAWTGATPMPAMMRAEVDTIRLIRATEVEAALRAMKEAVTQTAKVLATMKAGTSDRSSSNLAAGATAASVKVNAEVQDAMDRLKETVIGGPTLARSDYAYVVTSAPSANWARQFNRAYGSALLGDSDIVIKLNAQADFGVKGMRFDATTVAAVASKVTTQALLLGAQIAGVPVTTRGGTDTPGAQLSGASADLAASDLKQSQRAARLQAWKDAVREMAVAIFAAEEGLTGTNWQSNSRAVSAPIRSTFTQLRPTLSLTGFE